MLAHISSDFITFVSIYFLEEPDTPFELYPLRKEAFSKGGRLLQLFLFAIEEILEVLAHIVGRGGV